MISDTEKIERMARAFRECIIEQNESLKRGEHGNKYARKRGKIFKQLIEKYGDAGREALVPFLEDERSDVKVGVAVWLLRYKHKKAMQVLKDVSKTSGMSGFEAGEAIKRWNEGAWQLDLEDDKKKSNPTTEPKNKQASRLNRDKLRKKIEKHIADTFGKAPDVFHEIVSDDLHIDVYVVAPTKERNFYTLITCGMAEFPMNVPDGAEEYKHAELALSLPASWPLEEPYIQDERNYWPIRLLKVLARFPKDHNTWLGWGHTVPNGNPPEPYAEGIGLCGAIVLGLNTAPESFAKLEADKKTVYIYGVVPLHKDEMDYKVAKGVDPLLNKLEKHKVSALVYHTRESVCRKRFGLF